MLTPEEFDYIVLMRKYDSVKQAIKEGFDVNTPIPGRAYTFVETAGAGEDYAMMHILWEAGAIATTLWLENVFSSFEKGIIPVKKEKVLPKKMKKFKETNFSIKKVNILNSSLSLSEDGWNIELQIEPFELDGEIIDDTAIRLEYIVLPETSAKQFENKVFQFPNYPEDGYIDGSIYLCNVHNPVTVKTIAFKKYDDQSNTIGAKLDLEFDFFTIDLKNESYKLNTVLSTPTAETENN